jgi:hypothetical protein
MKALELKKKKEKRLNYLLNVNVFLRGRRKIQNEIYFFEKN